MAFRALPGASTTTSRDVLPGRFAAANLHGSLLLIHGAIDDNVHVQNTMQFVYELQKANKPFRLMLYPKSKHGIVDAALKVPDAQPVFTYFVNRLQVADRVTPYSMVSAAPGVTPSVTILVPTVTIEAVN